MSQSNYQYVPKEYANYYLKENFINMLQLTTVTYLLFRIKHVELTLCFSILQVTITSSYRGHPYPVLSMDLLFTDLAYLKSTRTNSAEGLEVEMIARSR